MLERLGNKLKDIFNKIAGAIFIDKKLIDEIARELQRTLIEADVDTKIVFSLTEKIKKEAAKDIGGIEKREQLIKLLNDEIIKLLGKEKYELQLEKKKLNKIMFLGLYGSGKTTTIAKLAQYYTKRGYKSCMLGLDVHRPAAPDQLEQLGKKISVPVFINKQEKNPGKIWKEFEQKIKDYELCFIDTAGRDVLDYSLIKEIKEITDTIKPTYIILVMTADIGQAARKQVEGFKSACPVSGVIITRMDGTAKAGGALVACSETSSPVLFIGTGEHITDIESFSPTSFVSRLLGMGDLQALLEKVKSATESKGKEEKKSEFTLLDFAEEIDKMQNVGPLNKIAELIPGIGGKMPPGLLDIQQDKIKKWRHAIKSMTPDEIQNPEIIKETRITRIAKGAGVNAGDVKDLLNQFKLVKGVAGKRQIPDMEQLQKGNISGLGLSQKQLRKLAKKFKGKMF
ncbi:signal recognition particle protein [Candidatus Pacearchaeota archaeon]|nr:signal recognition particle protein [Candidatus Pacearchaeota archaeon]